LSSRVPGRLADITQADDRSTGRKADLKALKFYRRRKRLKVDELMSYARVCRVEKVMRPYLEATL
jgi:hypothetical protein